MENTFIGEISRPSFVSSNYTFLLQPKFVLAHGLFIPFSWEIKCFKQLPPLSLEIIKITHGNGNKKQDFLKSFKVPKIMKFPVTNALPRKMNAVIRADCSLKIADPCIPYGMYSVIIKMEFWGTEYLLSQKFTLLKKL